MPDSARLEPGWRGAAQAGRDMWDACELIVKLCEDAQEREVSGQRVDKAALGDIGYALGVLESRAGRINQHLNGVVLRLADKDTR